MSESTEPKRFEDWPMKVDCNECQRHWDNSCDSVPQGSERRCNSFLATREIVIPGQIKELQRSVNRLRTGLILADILIVAMALAHLMGWY